MLREAADAGAEFVRCAEFVGAVVGYDYRDGPEGVGYYRVGDPAAESRLLLREAAAAGADFVRCPEDVGKVPGYLFATGVDGEVGYYRQPDAPPPDPYEYMSLVLQRASAAGAAFVACPNYVKEMPGYRRARSPMPVPVPMPMPVPMWAGQSRQALHHHCASPRASIAPPSHPATRPQPVCHGLARAGTPTGPTGGDTTCSSRTAGRLTTTRLKRRCGRWVQYEICSLYQNICRFL